MISISPQTQDLLLLLRRNRFTGAKLFRLRRRHHCTAIPTRRLPIFRSVSWDSVLSHKVRSEGLEPSCPKTQHPQCCAYAISATNACRIADSQGLLQSSGWAGQRSPDLRLFRPPLCQLSYPTKILPQAHHRQSGRGLSNLFLRFRYGDSDSNRDLAFIRR